MARKANPNTRGAFTKEDTKYLRDYRNSLKSVNAQMQDIGKASGLVEDKLKEATKSATKLAIQDKIRYDTMSKGEKERLKSEGDIAYFYQEYQNIPVDDSFRIFKQK